MRADLSRTAERGTGGDRLSRGASGTGLVETGIEPGQERQKRLHADDDEPLVFPQRQEPMVTGHEKLRLAGESRRQHQIVLGMSGHPRHDNGQRGDDRSTLQEKYEPLRIASTKALRKVGLCKRSLNLCKQV